MRCALVPQYEAYKEEIESVIRRVLGTGSYVLGREVAAFEKSFSSYIGVDHGVGVASGTDGLTLSLKALGIGRGDEVITTPFTAIPTVSAIVASGATPVFADIDPGSYLIDIDKAIAAVTARTKAVMPVHLFGMVVDIPRLRNAVGPGISIVEDACQAHGSRLGGAMAGSMGAAGVFSFYPTKNLGGYGDGGMVVTSDGTLTEKLRLIRMYGMVDKDRIVVDGVNSRLDEIQAAILNMKLAHLHVMNEKRSRIARRYREELRPELFEHQRIDEGVFANYHVFVSRFKGDRGRFIAHMDAGVIQTNIYYPIPLSLQKAHERLGYSRGDFPVAEKVCKEAIALPMYPELEEVTVSKIIDRINGFEG